MSRRRRAGVVAAALALIGGCGGSRASSPSIAVRPSVVVTTSILGDVVFEVAGGVAAIEVLMPAGVDPHSFAPSAAQAEALARADLVVINGLGLEEGVLRNVEAAADDGVTVLEVAPALDPLRYGPEAGDAAGSHDPHVWTDPARMLTAVGLIADAVGTLPEVDMAVLDAATERYSQRLAEMDESMAERFDAIPADARKLVTNHHVLAYFADRFDFDVVGAVLPSGTTLASPSSSDLEDLADVLVETGVPAIFADSSQPARLADVLAAEADLDVDVITLFTESLGPPGSGAETYLEMLATNTERIAGALSNG